MVASTGERGTGMAAQREGVLLRSFRCCGRLAWPAAHQGSHVACPAASWYVPALHGKHSERPAEEGCSIT